MGDAATAAEQRKGGLTGAITLVSVHLLAFAMFYLVMVQMNGAFRDFFLAEGIPTTPRLEVTNWISNILASFTPVVMFALILHLYLVFRLSRRASRWASAYSHASLLTMGCIAFLAASWTVHAVTRVTPGTADPGSTTVERSDHASS